MRIIAFIFVSLFALNAYALTHQEAQRLTECNAHGDGKPYSDGHIEYQKDWEYCAQLVPALWDKVREAENAK